MIPVMVDGEPFLRAYREVKINLQAPLVSGAGSLKGWRSDGRLKFGSLALVLFLFSVLSFSDHFSHWLLFHAVRAMKAKASRHRHKGKCHLRHTSLGKKGPMTE